MGAKLHKARQLTDDERLEMAISKELKRKDLNRQEHISNMIKEEPIPKVKKGIWNKIKGILKRLKGQ